MAMRLLAVSASQLDSILWQGRGQLHHVTWTLHKANEDGKELPGQARPGLKSFVLLYFHDCRNADTPTRTL